MADHYPADARKDEVRVQLFPPLFCTRRCLVHGAPELLCPLIVLPTLPNEDHLLGCVARTRRLGSPPTSARMCCCYCSCCCCCCCTCSYCCYCCYCFFVGILAAVVVDAVIAIVMMVVEAYGHVGAGGWFGGRFLRLVVIFQLGYVK